MCSAWWKPRSSIAAGREAACCAEARRPGVDGDQPVGAGRRAPRRVAQRGQHAAGIVHVVDEHDDEVGAGDRVGELTRLRRSGDVHEMEVAEGVVELQRQLAHLVLVEVGAQHPIAVPVQPDAGRAAALVDDEGQLGIALAQVRHDRTEGRRRPRRDRLAGEEQREPRRLGAASRQHGHGGRPAQAVGRRRQVLVRPLGIGAASDVGARRAQQLVDGPHDGVGPQGRAGRRRAAQQGLQRLAHGAGVRVAVGRVRCDGAPHDVVEAPGEVGPDVTQRLVRAPPLDVGERRQVARVVAGTATVVRADRPVGGHRVGELVEHEPEREEVAALRAAILEDLGGDVARGPGEPVGGAAARARHAEVAEHEVLVGREAVAPAPLLVAELAEAADQHVVRLEVVVHDVVVVERGEAVAELDAEADELLQRQARAARSQRLDPAVERPVLGEVHDEPRHLLVAVDVAGGNDSVLGDAEEQLSLGEEHLAFLLVAGEVATQDLDRVALLDRCVLGQVDRGERAFADLLDDLIGAEARRIEVAVGDRVSARPDHHRLPLARRRARRWPPGGAAGRG